MITKQSRFYDNTMLSSYKDCPRKYFLRHVLNWRAQGISDPLVFGLSWHSAMDVVWAQAKTHPRKDIAHNALAAFRLTWEEQGMPGDLTLEDIDRLSPRTPSIAAEMLVSYIDKRWGILQESVLVAGEQPFAVPLPGTEDTWYVGRLDKTLDHEGRLLVVEHKTTTEYKKDGGFKPSWVESWYSDSQVKGYQFGGGLFFPGLTQVWVDGALVHKIVHDAFRFVPVAHQFPLLQEWVDDTRQWVARVEHDTAKYNAQGKLGNGVFPKSENSCHGKYGPCPFLDICRTTPDPSQLDGPPGHYIEDRWEPFSVLNLDTLIKDEKL